MIKDYFNTEIISFSTSNNNDINLIKDSYKDFKPTKNAMVNKVQGEIYFAYEYLELAKKKRFTRSMFYREHCWENWFMQLENEWLC